jgi:hypothetical protein
MIILLANKGNNTLRTNILNILIINGVQRYDIFSKHKHFFYENNVFI